MPFSQPHEVCKAILAKAKQDISEELANEYPPKHNLTKEQLDEEKTRTMANIEDIYAMSAEAVMEFKQKISMSTARPKVKEWLYAACDDRLMQLNDRQQLMAVNGDMDDFN
jgi:hypothetical protein